MYGHFEWVSRSPERSEGEEYYSAQGKLRAAIPEIASAEPVSLAMTSETCRSDLLRFLSF